LYVEMAHAGSAVAPAASPRTPCGSSVMPTPGALMLDGIGTVTFGCAILYHLLNGRMTGTRTL
jgi:hypothetical protein